MLVLLPIEAHVHRFIFCIRFGRIDWFWKHLDLIEISALMTMHANECENRFSIYTYCAHVCMYPLYICEMNSDNSKMVHTDASDCVRSLFAVLTNTNLVYVFSSQHTQSD